MWYSMRTAALAMLLVAGPVVSARAADADHGAALARQWCAGCHAIGGSDAVRADIPPSFASIARRPGTSEDTLRAWLATPHPSMPDFDLSRSALADLTAYILSLAPRRTE